MTYDNRAYPNRMRTRHITAVKLAKDPADHETYNWWVAGKDGIRQILEHSPAGEGDRWYYDIHLDDGQVFRRFDIIGVQFGPEET